MYIYLILYQPNNSLTMKKILLYIGLLIGFVGFAQDHFSGISTSSRIGILNGNVNPAEFSNLSKMVEVNLYGLSFSASNDKIGLKDISGSSDIEKILFQGDKPINARVDAQIIGPSVAFKILKWGFGITTKGNVKYDIIDFSPALGNALINNNLENGISQSINSGLNQRVNSVSYGEVGFSAGRTFYETKTYKFSAGITFKMLFPGSYSNFGLNNLNGSVTQDVNGVFLTTTQPANLNIAFSGNLANGFNDSGNYTKSVFGGLNGLATDIGFTYQLKDDNKYKVKVGMSVRNIGSMTFKDDNNQSTNYTLNVIPDKTLNLNIFNDLTGLEDVKKYLVDNHYMTETASTKNFKVQLPTTFTTYVDLKVIPKVYVTAYMQQKVNKDNGNNQITTPNIYSITPRVNLGFFEAYVPVSVNEISGTNVGLGFRLGGFYMGTSSLVSALIQNNKQGDFYTGFRWSIL